MASNGYLPTPVFRPEQGSTGVPKVNTGPQQNMGPSKPISGLYANHHFDPSITKPALINIQDCCPNSTLLSFKFPQSELTQVEKDGLDLYSLSPGYNPSVLDSRERVIDFVGDLVRHSEILPVLAELYLSKSLTSWPKSLVPQINRLDYGSALELETVIVAPPKSPEKIKPKKKGARNKTVIKHRSNYIRACESLLSIIVDKNRNGKSAIPVLKKTGPELPNLLTQFSASIAGTGMAVLFSVMCKVASGRVAFGSSKLLNTGLGLGLVWLSWAVNRLRDAVVMISKNSNKKMGLKDEEMMKNLDTSVKEIYFRAAALMAVMVLRLA